MKRTAVATVTLTCLLGAGAGVWAVAGFSDVPDDHPQAVDIAYSVEQGWFTGYEDRTFRPDQKLTTHQAVTVFGRAFADGVSRADLATILRAGETALAEVGGPEFGSWERFEGAHLWGSYEGHAVWDSDGIGAVLRLRCETGARAEEWERDYDGVWVWVPYKVANLDDAPLWDAESGEYTEGPAAGVRYRFSDEKGIVTDTEWWSDEEPESTVWARTSFWRSLAETEAEALYMAVETEEDGDVYLEFDLRGLGAVLEQLECF